MEQVCGLVCNQSQFVQKSYQNRNAIQRIAAWIVSMADQEFPFDYTIRNFYICVCLETALRDQFFWSQLHE